MIKMLVAYTTEVDEAPQAIAEILEQLNLEKNQLKNSVGLLTCHVDFLATGVVEELCAKLTFDVLGITTLGSGTNEITDLCALTLSVLTSNDVSFSTVLTDSLMDEQEAPVKAAYSQAAAKLPGENSLILACAPMLNHVGGEKLVRLIDKASDGVPVFGTLTCDHNFDFHESRVIYNGNAYTDCMALVLMSGPVNAKFMYISVPVENVQKQSAVITSSCGNRVQTVNGKPVLEYLSSIGLSAENGLEGSKSIPIILDYNDGTSPVTRCFYMISPEGEAVCGGDMPCNATFALGSMDFDDVIISTTQLLDKVIAGGENNGLLIMSCIVRSVTLGIDQRAEGEKVRELIDGKMVYQLCYSGGEICPVYDENGKATNRFHNFSFAVCIF